METTKSPKKKMGKGLKILLIVIGAFILLGIIANSGSDSNNTSTTKETPGIGQPLKTDYFEVTVSKVDETKRIHPDEFTDEKAGEGNKYLVMNTTFKNINNETRTMFDGGTLFVNYNGKEYKFDTPETIPADGYGVLLEPLNPMVSKTTKIVFKLPDNITGPAYYQPTRADDDQRISLGIIK